MEQGDDQAFIYPNPTSGVTSIYSMNGFDRITVYNVSGEKVDVDYNSASGTLDASNLQARVYMVETISSNKRSIQKRIKQ